MLISWYVLILYQLLRMPVWHGTVPVCTEPTACWKWPTYNQEMAICPRACIHALPYSCRLSTSCVFIPFCLLGSIGRQNRQRPYSPGALITTALSQVATRALKKNQDEEYDRKLLSSAVLCTVDLLFAVWTGTIKSYLHPYVALSVLWECYRAGDSLRI